MKTEETLLTRSLRIARSQRDLFTEQEPVLEQRDPGAYPFIEPCPPVYRAEKISSTQLESVLLFQQYCKGNKRFCYEVNRESQQNLDAGRTQYLSDKGATTDYDTKEVELIQAFETPLRLLECQEEKGNQSLIVDNRNNQKSLSPVFGQQPSFVDY